MNRINQLFSTSKQNLLSIYFCAGYPALNDTTAIIRSLETHGVDMIEIGIPFSDPMADSPTIQHAATRALHNGMTLHLLFEQLKNIRSSVQVPLILTGYLNPIMQYGFENFCHSCRECGIDGVIIPDLPFLNYQEEYRAVADRYDIRMIMLITPETSAERVRMIDCHTDGFIYMISSAAMAGAREDFDAAQKKYFQRIDAMQLRNPRMIGTGISNKATFDAACRNSRGGIIGSRFVELLEQEKDADRAIELLIEDLKR